MSEPDDPPDDQGVAGALLAELEAGGEFVDAGGFSIDGAQARRKLREFQLSDPHGYVLLLIEAAVIAGADPVRVIAGGDVLVELGRLAIGRVELEQLFAAAFIELGEVDEAERRRRRALQKLAFACNAALGVGAKAVELEVVDEDRALCMRFAPDDDRGELVELDRGDSRGLGTRVRVRYGWVVATQPREAELIRERCLYSSTKIELDGEQISRGLREALHVELDPERPALTSNARRVRPIELDGRRIGAAGLRYSGGKPAELLILTNGVLVERFELEREGYAATDFAAIVDVDLPKDLGQARLLRGPEFEAVIAAVWEVHDRIAPPPKAGSDAEAADRAAAMSAKPLLVMLFGFGVVMIVLARLFPRIEGLGWLGWILVLAIALGIVLVRNTDDGGSNG